LVSVEAARRDYGVALNADGTVDDARTVALRRELRRRKPAAAARIDTVAGDTVDATVTDTVTDITVAAKNANTVATPSRGRARIGVVVPVSNANLEPDLAQLRPRGVSLHFARVGGYDLDAVPDAAQMRRLAQASLDDIVDSLAACRADVILYGCTSATLACGPDFDRDLRRCIESRVAAVGVKAPAVTAAAAVVEALRDLGAARVGLATPYTAALNRDAAAYLEACGVEVVAVAGVEAELDNYGQGALSPDEVLALGLRASHAAADAIVLSCTDMRAVEVIGALEAAVAKPVVTSNQALMYAALKRLNARADVELLTAPAGFGRLLAAGFAPANAVKLAATA